MASVDKMIELQYQVRQNQAELGSYVDELNDWTSEIKKKEESLKSKKPTATEQKDLPPIRNVFQKKKKRKVKKDKAKSETKQKIKGSDFRAWDKFDVEKALEEVDEKQSSSSEYETDEEWELERRKEQAKVYKNEGNDHYKHGRFMEAIECYSKGFELDPTNADIPSNRAQALIKQDCYAAAEVDCTTALALRPGFDKALFRRARSRQLLGKRTDALQDLKEVLRLNPKNSEARKLLYKIEEDLKPAPEKRPGLVVPIYKSHEKRSKKPLVRVTIQETGVEDVAAALKRHEKDARSAQSDMTRRTLQREEQQFNQLFSGGGDVTTAGGDKSSSEKPTSSDRQWKKSAEPSSKPSASVTEEAPASSAKTTPPEAVSGLPCARVAADEEDLPDVPKTSYQFQQDWRRLKSDPLMFYLYFKRLPFTRYPQLFGENLDSALLSSIIKVLKDHYLSNSDPAVECLENLTKVKRFSFAVMFMSGEDKSDLRHIFEKLKSCEGSTNIAALAAKYEVTL